jgi:hypothetical protein
VTVDTGTNLKYTYQWKNIAFNNFFKPHLSALLVSGSGAVKTITWSVSDFNAGDEHFYEVYISSDNGVTYQLLAAHLTSTSYTWDTTGFLQGTYKVKILVHDNDPALNTASYGNYWPGYSDFLVSSAFSAGTVTTPTTPTTTSTSTTTPLSTTGGIDPLWIGLFGGIGVGILVVLILFLVRKK